MKKIIIILMLIILSISVMAEFQTSDNTNQLNIIYPQKDIYQSKSNITMNFNVYNSNGIIQNNDTIQCTYTLFDNKGNILLSEQTNYNSNLFTINLSDSITNIAQKCTYTLNCENTTNGGYVSGNIHLTPDGRNHDNKLYEIIAILTTFLLAWVIAGNMGANVNVLRRFVSASLVLLTGFIALYTLAITNYGVTITPIGFTIALISTIYFIIQVGICIRDKLQEFIKDQK